MVKALHWIIFSLAAWILLVPFIGDELLQLIGFKTLDEHQIIELLRWDDLFLGIAIFVIALVVLTLEQASHKTPGLKAMHWMQVALGFWLAIAPFATTFDYTAFTWSHFVAGGFIAVFALLQLNYE